MQAPLALDLHFQNLSVILHKRRMMAHAYERRGSCKYSFVECGFIFAVERACGFVQQRVTRILQEYSCESQPLALTGRQLFFKFEVGVKAATALDQTVQIHKV